MLKKILMILSVITLISLCSSSKKVNFVPFSIKCYKCGNWNNIANRSIRDEHNTEYAIYRCQHGHILYVNYNNGERK